MKTSFFSTAALFGAAAAVSGADYAQTFASLNQLGGTSSTSAHYQQTAYLSEKAPGVEPGEQSVKMLDTLDAQQIQVIGLQIVAGQAELNEGDSTEVEAYWTMDDATMAKIGSGTQVTWSPMVATTAQTLLTTEPVPQDTELIVTAAAESFETAAAFLVKNVENDDFGLYAADGVDDAWQVRHFGLTNPDGHGDQDPDGDGLTNREEFEAGSDPNAGAPGNTNPATPEIQWIDLRKNAEGYTLTFEATPNQTYEVQHSSDLTPGSWQTIQTLEPSEETARAIVISQTDVKEGFFRVVISE